MNGKLNFQWNHLHFLGLMLLGMLLAITMASCKPGLSEAPLFINSTQKEITYLGRMDTTAADGYKLYWSGTSIKLNFKGSSIAALLSDDMGDNYYNVILDNDAPMLLRPDTIKRFHILADGLSDGKHSIEIFKRTEWDRGTTTFYGFELDSAAVLLPPDTIPKRKIEFYGNSITAGYAVEDLTGKDSPDSTYTNNYNSYAAITARHFKSDYRCIARSGIGVTVSWFPLTMPDLYDRLDPHDPESKWDFSSYQPEVVVVNLLQNDSWLVHLPNHPEFQRQFGTEAPTDEFIINAYQQFITQIRSHYPKTHIICTLGNMDATKKESKWRSFIETAVQNLEDEQIYTHFFEYKGTPGHPSIKEQELMAQSLIQFIDRHITWELE